MSVTLNDIARLSGFDVSSVSRTLGNHPRAMLLRPETRRRIKEVARQLGYRRNELAAATRTGLTRTVAVICGHDRNLPSDSSMVITGILQGATLLGHDVKIYSDGDLDAAFDKILGGQIQNVISISPLKAERRRAAELCAIHGMKMIFVYGRPEPGHMAAATDNRRAARDAVAHMTGRGHKRIGFVSGPLDEDYTLERHKGYLEGLADAGLNADSKFLVCHPDAGGWTVALEKIMRLRPDRRPTAFFCSTDSTAFLLQRIAVRSGLRVPEDVSVVGFGNVSVCDYALSPITSVSESYMDLGGTAFRILVGEETNMAADKDGRILLPGRLVVRESVADLRAKCMPRADKRRREEEVEVCMRS